MPWSNRRNHGPVNFKRHGSAKQRDRNHDPPSSPKTGQNSFDSAQGAILNSNELAYFQVGAGFDSHADRNHFLNGFNLRFLNWNGYAARSDDANDAWSD